MIKKIIALLALIPIVAVIAYYIFNASSNQFESVCGKASQKQTEYCEDIGKRAYSISALRGISEKDFGPIVGVVWRTKGGIISSPGRKKRYAESNSYYYIVGTDGSDYQFLRAVSETDPK